MAPPDPATANNQRRYSYAVQVSDVVNVTGPLAANMSWDGWWRLAYDRADRLIQKQANILLERGNVTMAEARDLVEVQRNGMVIEYRKPLSPFGKFYSETLKPASSLPTLENMLERKGSVEAVLTSVGKTRTAVNRIAFIGRSVGTEGFVVEIVCVIVVIEEAPADQKGLVAAEQIGGSVGGLAAGTGGYWAGGLAGAAWAGTWVSPTLAIPVIGEITEGGAIVIGGIAGALFFGWAGHKAGTAAGHYLWTMLPVTWTRK